MDAKDWLLPAQGKWVFDNAACNILPPLWVIVGKTRHPQVYEDLIVAILGSSMFYLLKGEHTPSNDPALPLQLYLLARSIVAAASG